MVNEKASQTIWLAKGIGIFLVVVGHCSVPGTQPDVWSLSRGVIYSFHMPLFIFISGWLLGTKDFAAQNPRDLLAFWAQKGKRLLVPYFSVTILLLSVKFISGFFFTLQYPITSDFYRYIFLNPMGGFATLLWFIYTLFVIFIVYPVLIYVFRQEWLVLLLAIGLSFLHFPEVFCLDKVFHYLPFFAFGVLFAKHDLLEKINVPSMLVGSFALFALCYPYGRGFMGEQLDAMILGTTGVLFCVFIAHFFSKTSSDPFFLTRIFGVLGMYSSSIYLLHTLAMGPVRIALYQIIKVGQTGFVPSIFLIICAGLVVPIIAHIYIYCGPIDCYGV